MMFAIFFYIIKNDATGISYIFTSLYVYNKHAVKVYVKCNYRYVFESIKEEGQRRTNVFIL